MIALQQEIVPHQKDPGVARLFRFERNSGVAKIWQPDELICCYRSKANGPRKTLDDGQVLRATIVITSIVLIYSHLKIGTKSNAEFDV